MNRPWIPTGGSTGSTLTHLEGGLSAARYPADELVNLDPADGKPLLPRYDLERAAAALSRESLATRRTGRISAQRQTPPVRRVAEWPSR